MKKPALCIWITLLSIAMGLFECIVVIYLRKLYYPGGFHFPLAIADSDVTGVSSKIKALDRIGQ